MDCKDFLDDYSDFLDRRLEERSLKEYREHLRSCSSCAEYDQVMQRGLRLVRQLPEPEPPPDFVPRLEHRLLNVRDELVRGPAQGSRTATVTALLITGLLVAGSFSFLGSGDVPELPPVVVEAPASSARGSGPPGIFSTLPSGPNLLIVPDISQEPWLISTSSRFSLFRAPLGTLQRRPRPSESETED